MKIKYVEIENILSIQKIRLDFGEAGLILLDGWNHDDETANGAGKTAILNSIAYGLYGEFPRKISKADILRTGTKSGYVKVGVEIGGTLYEVHRGRPTVLMFWIDGLEKTITQTEFESYIRLSYSQYLISQYSAQTEGLKLISLNDGGKKDFFLQLMSLDHFDSARKKAETELNLLVFEKNKVLASISGLKSRIEAYTESLVDVSDLELKIEELDPTPLQEELDALQIERPDTSKFDSVEEKLINELQSIRIAQEKAISNVSQLARLDKQIAKLKQPLKLTNQVECPHCSESFVLGEDGAITIDHIKTERQILLDQLIEERDEFALPENEEELEEKATKIRHLIAKCKLKKASELEQYNATLQTVADLKSAISRRQSQVGVFQEAIDKNIQLQEKIEQSNRLVALAESDISKLDIEIELFETVAGIFSTTGAPAYVLDSAVDVFNEKVATYATLIWPNASYTLQSFKENKSGDVKAKFSEKLVINGKDRSIGALSGGEHRCLSLAVDFAVIDVLETMFGISMNPIMLDEPFNDLDASNRERVLELLDKISTNRQIWVIDHASEAKAMFSHVVKVEKRSGISSLV